MNNFESKDLLNPKMFKEQTFLPDLSNSTLSDDEKHCLTDKIKQMQCEAFIKRNLKVPIALTRTDFNKACLAKRIYLSTVRGNTMDEVIEKIHTDTQRWESEIIINFVFKEEPRMKELTKLFEKIACFSNSTQPIWGMAIDQNASENYCFELITYS